MIIGVWVLDVRARGLQAVRETSGFTERVHLFLDLIISYEVRLEGQEGGE